MGRKQAFFGKAIWKTGVSEIVFWQHNKVIYLYAPDRTIIFDPSEVRTRGVKAANPGISAQTINTSAAEVPDAVCGVASALKLRINDFVGCIASAW